MVEYGSKKKKPSHCLHNPLLAEFHCVGFSRQLWWCTEGGVGAVRCTCVVGARRARGGRPGQHRGLFAQPHLTSRDSCFVSSAARATRDGLFRAACSIQFTLTGSVFSALLSLSFLSLVSFCCKYYSYNIDETKSDIRMAGHRCRATRSLGRK